MNTLTLPLPFPLNIYLPIIHLVFLNIVSAITSGKGFAHFQIQARVEGDQAGVTQRYDGAAGSRRDVCKNISEKQRKQEKGQRS